MRMEKLIFISHHESSLWRASPLVKFVVCRKWVAQVGNLVASKKPPLIRGPSDKN